MVSLENIVQLKRLLNANGMEILSFEDLDFNLIGQSLIKYYLIKNFRIIDDQLMRSNEFILHKMNYGGNERMSKIKKFIRRYKKNSKAPPYLYHDFILMVDTFSYDYRLNYRSIEDYCMAYSFECMIVQIAIEGRNGKIVDFPFCYFLI